MLVYLSAISPQNRSFIKRVDINWQTYGYEVQNKKLTKAAITLLRQCTGLKTLRLDTSYMVWRNSLAMPEENISLLEWRFELTVQLWSRLLRTLQPHKLGTFTWRLILQKDVYHANKPSSAEDSVVIDMGEKGGPVNVNEDALEAADTSAQNLANDVVVKYHPDFGAITRPEHIHTVSDLMAGPLRLRQHLMLPREAAEQSPAKQAELTQALSLSGLHVWGEGRGGGGKSFLVFKPHLGIWNS